MIELKPLISKGAGEIDPISVDEYTAIGGFASLKKAASMTSGAIVTEIKKARLLGRGGAAYPAGHKWEHLLHIPETPKYIVCNADEGEPGTFKDRLILEKLPLRLIEGMIIAGYVFGSQNGYIYVRGEYRLIQKKLRQAIENARSAGYLGHSILGMDFDFELEVVSGAGAYVCGENSALLNSTEGKVGRPRIKPPHLAEVGLFQKPTLVNNVETMSAIPAVIDMGGEAFLELGHPESGGTKLICLSGHVKNRGVFEVPLGRITLRDAIYDSSLGGGLSSGQLGFFHLGGQSGPIGGESLLDTPYSYSDLKKAGLAVGSGAIVVMDDTVSLLDYLLEVADFFLGESCGKCVPCREGNLQLWAVLQKLSVAGEASSQDLLTLRALIETMSSSSFCGLGQSATTGLSSAWKHLKSKVEVNVKVA